MIRFKTTISQNTGQLKSPRRNQKPKNGLYNTFTPQQITPSDLILNENSMNRFCADEHTNPACRLTWDLRCLARQLGRMLVRPGSQLPFLGSLQLTLHLLIHGIHVGRGHREICYNGKCFPSLLHSCGFSESNFCSLKFICSMLQSGQLCCFMWELHQPRIEPAREA